MTRSLFLGSSSMNKPRVRSWAKYITVQPESPLIKVLYFTKFALNCSFYFDFSTPLWVSWKGVKILWLDFEAGASIKMAQVFHVFCILISNPCLQNKLRVVWLDSKASRYWQKWYHEKLLERMERFILILLQFSKWVTESSRSSSKRIQTAVKRIYKN